jgi:hypothetical protein
MVLGISDTIVKGIRSVFDRSQIICTSGKAQIGRSCSFYRKCSTNLIIMYDGYLKHLNHWDPLTYTVTAFEFFVLQTT